MWLSERIKRKRLVINCMRLSFFWEKPTTPLHHERKTIKKHMFQRKNLFIKIFLLEWKLLKHFWKRKKMGKTYTGFWTLGWGVAEVSLPLWKKKYRIKTERPERKCLESSWAVFTSIFMNDKGPSHILKVHFSSLLSLTGSLCK